MGRGARNAPATSAGQDPNRHVNELLPGGTGGDCGVVDDPSADIGAKAAMAPTTRPNATATPVRRTPHLDSRPLA